MINKVFLEIMINKVMLVVSSKKELC